MDKDNKAGPSNSSNQKQGNEQQRLPIGRHIPGTTRVAIRFVPVGPSASANQNESVPDDSAPNNTDNNVPEEVPDSERIKLLANVSVSVGSVDKWYEDEKNLEAETQLIQKYKQEMTSEEWEEISTKCETVFTRNYNYNLWTEEEDALLVDLFQTNKKKSNSEVKKTIMKNRGYERTATSIYGRWKRLEKSKKQVITEMLNRGKTWTEKQDKILAYCVFKYPDFGVRAWSLMSMSLKSFDFSSTPSECKGRWFYLVNCHIQNSQ